MTYYIINDIDKLGVSMNTTPKIKGLRGLNAKEVVVVNRLEAEKALRLVREHFALAIDAALKMKGAKGGK